jgi:hypothetical protein
MSKHRSKNHRKENAAQAQPQVETIGVMPRPAAPTALQKTLFALTVFMEICWVVFLAVLAIMK